MSRANLSAADEIDRLRAEVGRLTFLNDDKFKCLQAYRKAADEDRATIARLTRERDAYLGWILDPSKPHLVATLRKIVGLDPNPTGLLPDYHPEDDGSSEEEDRAAAGLDPEPGPAGESLDRGYIFEVDYINYKGERYPRRIIPRSIRWGSNEWHPKPQWLLDAFDCEKGAERTFALRGIRTWTPLGGEPGPAARYSDQDSIEGRDRSR